MNLLSENQKKQFEADGFILIKVRLSLWNHPGDNIYGMFARCNKMVDRAEELRRRKSVLA